MMKKKKKFAIFSVVLLAALGTLIYIYSTIPTQQQLSELQDGDIVFQTSKSPQSLAVGLASLSLYTHMGIIKHTQRGFLVIEAGSPARETPLQNWINEGRLKRITVERVKNIEPKDMSRVLRKAKAYYGSSYDPYFIFDDKKMYCSELVYLAFKNSGIELGHLQPLKSLFVYNPAVKSLFKERWESHPSCAKDKAKSADECWAKISEQQLITPRSIAEDPKLETIYTNYLF